MKRIFAMLSLFALTIACKQVKNESDTPSKMEAVMAIHDEVMPKMGTLGKLVAELNEKVDTTASGKAYETAMKDLQTANTSMMDWMQGFGNRFDSDEILNGKTLSAQKKLWLLEEEVKVKALREEINTSIARAQELLKE